MMRLNVKRLDPEAKLPVRSLATAAGLDLFALLPVALYPNKPVAVRTGIALQIPNGYAGLIWDRSGLGRKGVRTLAGVIDQDYEGEIVVCLVMIGHEPHQIHAGDRIAQLLITPVPEIVVCESWESRESVRGSNGFGSTGA